MWISAVILSHKAIIAICHYRKKSELLIKFIYQRKPFVKMSQNTMYIGRSIWILTKRIAVIFGFNKSSLIRRGGGHAGMDDIWKSGYPARVLDRNLAWILITRTERRYCARHRPWFPMREWKNSWCLPVGTMIIRNAAARNTWWRTGSAAGWLENLFILAD